MVAFPGEGCGVIAWAALAYRVEGVSGEFPVQDPVAAVGPFPGAESAERYCGSRRAGTEPFQLPETVVGHEPGVAAGHGVPGDAGVKVICGPGKPPLLAAGGFPSCHGDAGSGPEAIAVRRPFGAHAGAPVR